MARGEEIVNEITKKIVNDPTIERNEHILVSFGKKGFGPFKKPEFRLKGVVHKESDKAKAEEHAKASAGDTPVVSEIEVRTPRQ